MFLNNRGTKRRMKLANLQIIRPKRHLFKHFLYNRGIKRRMNSRNYQIIRPNRHLFKHFLYNRGTKRRMNSRNYQIIRPNVPLFQHFLRIEADDFNKNINHPPHIQNKRRIFTQKENTRETNDC